MHLMDMRPSMLHGTPPCGGRTAIVGIVRTGLRIIKNATATQDISKDFLCFNVF
jgi:hypothetical protein